MICLQKYINLNNIEQPSLQMLYEWSFSISQVVPILDGLIEECNVNIEF